MYSKFNLTLQFECIYYGSPFFLPRNSLKNQITTDMFKTTSWKYMVNNKGVHTLMYFIFTYTSSFILLVIVTCYLSLFKHHYTLLNADISTLPNFRFYNDM